MSGERPKSDKPEGKEDYESTVIDFLDREISASAKPTNNQDAAPDELDALVANLLKDVITTSDEEKPAPEAGEENFDALLSGIFKQSEEPQARPENVLSVVEPAHESKVGAPVSAAVRVAMVRELPGKPGPAQTVSASKETVSVVAKGSSPPARVGASQPETHRKTEKKDSGKPAVADSPVFSLSQKRPVRSNQGLVITLASVCLLASIGFGIYHFTGSSSRQSALSVSPPQPASVIPSTPPQAAPIQIAQNLKTEKPKALGQQKDGAAVNPDRSSAAAPEWVKGLHRSEKEKPNP